MIPQTFNEWTICIVKNCKITLTKEFTTQRMAFYQDNKNVETQKFISLNGQQHLLNIIQQLQQT